MLKKIALWLLWIGFSIYAFMLAPPDQPDTFELIQKLSTGQWENINPLIVSLFNIMGIWPLIYSCLMFFDGRGQKTPAWLFSTLSFGVGAFAILPYLGWRQPNPNFSGKKNLFLNILDSRILGISLTLATILLLIYGLTNGDWEDFIQQWQSSRFIHVMSLDFCLLCLLFPTLLGDDMSRRGMKKYPWYWIALVPLLGPLIYLSVRSPLLAADASTISNQQEATFNN
ncbi:DUF2834 domain-containing protein [Okeania sp. SIO2B3]|uniref:DUF2834 domain-containing protein n=1 Tax=Okeania sp. SIO2B3 TaxID=2607784 RepID=UPI0013C0933A|nr:DUF2834 domain-containing protein [Okeania sp. SIO2B3]NET40431.1 DUF2834 domain-containing protein [Okeania sp. SIO2B3]